jgi:hypothetical protein
VALDLPKGWTTTEKPDGIVLVPEGWNAANAEEVYVLVSDPSVPSLDSPDADAAVERMAAQMGGTFEKKGSPTKETYGDLQGRLFRYSGTANDGRSLDLRVHGFSSGSGVAALIAIGRPERLSSREGALKAILGSLHKAAAPGGGGGGGGGSHPELAGTWNYLSNVTALDGGRTTESYVTLNADGSYVWHWEVVDTNSLGGAWGQEDDRGTWSATDSSLTLRSNEGRTSTMTLEKRNHPKNTNDPMIVLDGKAYVTATTRSPW